MTGDPPSRSPGDRAPLPGHRTPGPRAALPGPGPRAPGPGLPPSSFGLLQRTCRLLVLLCSLHISVTVFLYVRSSLDLRFSLPQSQQPRARGGGRPGPGTGGITGGTGGTNGTNGTADRGPRGPLKKCPETSPLLVGPLRVEFGDPVSLDRVRQENPRVRRGGRYRPADCAAQQKVALIIPFRRREEHLKFWLFYLHPVLQRQQLDYGVYVVNQDGDQVFNRAKLLNVGVVEALKDDDYDCFVFSDVDLIPLDDRNQYRCFSQPRHLSVAMDKFGFRLPYNQYFGGVSSLSREQFQKINGFPNNYWGWGGEDDDIYNRIVFRGMSVSRPSGEIGRCRMIRHNRDKQNEPNPQRFNRIAHTRETMNSDGISSLSYKLVKLEKLDLYTLITVDVGRP
ncbi:beta-1,4-galactosyltransferase 1 [Cololabis saira]|uniref:beta-1,4-galactosyltransferase 1 n=1 Tax=Cololabis saira TaxID=129043 RepID=UPI002AD3E5EA|nr:beta-1,4-galactosyltransferase 1 [Cololabis saira]